LANIEDPNAKDAQKLCPGHTATSVWNSLGGVSARLMLAGANCSVYEIDIKLVLFSFTLIRRLTTNYAPVGNQLDLRVLFGPKSRLNVRILPVEIAGEQESWYDMKEDYLTRKVNGVHFNPEDSELDFRFNRSPFKFSVAGKSAGDVLFSTKGSKLVFESQFLGFPTELPEKYNLYGLGEVTHNIKLGNKYNRTLFNKCEVQSHLAIPERAEPDTALNRTKFVAPPDCHAIHPVKPETGKSRIRMVSWSTPPPATVCNFRPPPAAQFPLLTPYFSNPLDENLYGSPPHYEPRHATLKDDSKKGYSRTSLSRMAIFRGFHPGQRGSRTTGYHE